MTVYDSCIVLGNSNLVSRTQHFQCCLLQLQALLLRNNNTASQYSDILQHSLATVAETWSLYSTDLQTATQTVNNQCCQSLRINILSDYQQRTTALSSWLENWQELLQVRNLLIVKKDVWVIHYTLHLVCVSHEVTTQVTTVELHTLNNTDIGITALALLDSDDTILRNLAHSVSQELTNLCIVVGRNSSHLLNLIIVVIYLLSMILDEGNDSSNSLVDTTLQIHWVSTCCYVLQALSYDSLSQDSSCCSTVTGIITSLAGNALYELCTGILKLVLQLYFLSYGNTILSNLRSTKLLFDYHIASLRTKSYLYCICQLINTLLQEVAGIHIIFNIFSHFFILN